MVRSAETRPLRDDDVGRDALTQAERTGAIRAGWNDAAWRRGRRAVRDRTKIAHSQFKTPATGVEIGQNQQK